MQGKNRYFRRSHLSEAKFRIIIRYFAHDLQAWKIAELSGVSRPTINQLFMKLRIRIAQVCNASSPLFGEVEVDESYFGARRVRGKKGCGADRGLQSSMLFPDKRSFYTSRNVNSDFITERKISLIEYLLY